MQFDNFAAAGKFWKDAAQGNLQLRSSEGFVAAVKSQLLSNFHSQLPEIGKLASKFDMKCQILERKWKNLVINWKFLEES